MVYIGFEKSISASKLSRSISLDNLKPLTIDFALSLISSKRFSLSLYKFSLISL